MLWTRGWLRAVPLVLIVFGVSGSAFAEWEKVDSKTLSWLRAVAFANEHSAWAVGTAGTILKTDDSGRTWIRLPSPTKDSIVDVHFIDTSIIWLLCMSDIYGPTVKAPSYFLRSKDGGITWEHIWPAKGRERIARMAFSKKGRGYAVGEGGIVWELLQDDRWQPRVTGSKFLLRGAHFSHDGDGVAVGGGGSIVATHDGGTTWSHQTLGDGDRARKLNSISIDAAGMLWAVGAGGRLYSSSDRGAAWVRHDTKTTEDLLDISFGKDRLGFVVGQNGTILATDDGGKSWLPENSNTKHRIERVGFSKRNAIAVGFGGTILVRGFTRRKAEEQP